jgi:N-acetylglucosamine repressor
VRDNRRAVLKTIYDRREISRADIARSLQLTRGTVSNIVAQLIEDGLVREMGTGISDGGKPPVILKLDEHGRHLIGLDLANSHFQGAVTDLRGNILYRCQLPMHDQDGEAALALVYELVDALIPSTGQPILGIGIGAPGLIDGPRGIIRQAVNLLWRDLPLCDLLRERYDLPCYISNDSHAAAVGEYVFGQSARGKKHQIVVKAGKGISAGILLDGQLYVGEKSSAGEIGHITLIDNGEVCSCGNTGCLETVVNTAVLVRIAQEIAWQNSSSPLHRYVSTPDMITIDVVYQACNDGDPVLQQKAAEMGRYLGMAIANIVGLLNVETILIGGSLAELGEPFLDAIRHEFYRRLNPLLAGETRIEICSLGKDELVLKGAAALLLSNELGLV